MMNKLWAPWRIKYIQDFESSFDGCVFCGKMQQSNDRENLVLHRGENSFVVMNLYPYNNGHLMIIPYCHVSDLFTVNEATSSEMWKLLGLSRDVLALAFKPDGFNIGINLGRSAGAGIDQHVHIHVVPRWNGDTNFMPIITDTKVISQGLWDTYDALLPHFRSIAGISSGDAPGQ